MKRSVFVPSKMVAASHALLAIEHLKCASETEELNFKFYLGWIHLNLNSYMWLVAAIYGSEGLEPLEGDDDAERGRRMGVHQSLSCDSLGSLFCKPFYWGMIDIQKTVDA